VDDTSCQTLWDTPLDNGETALISSVNVELEQGLSESDQHADDPEFIVRRDSAKIACNDPWVHEQARICVAVAFAFAFANKRDICAFLPFPEARMQRVNRIRDTNNSNDHLLPFPCQSFSRKQAAFLKVWQPKQKRSSFPWVFKFALTSLFDPSAFLRMRLVMVDARNSELAKAALDHM
jgi:hypothetical protein